jgi:hypothetical protein
LSKASHVHAAADRCDCPVRWHKIALNREPGKVDLYRPGYSHLICLSKKRGPGPTCSDVIPPSGRVYKNGVPVAVAQFAARFLKDVGESVLLDPFCGRGTFLAAAEAIKLDAIGIDIDPEQVKAARLLPWTQLLPSSGLVF